MHARNLKTDMGIHKNIVYFMPYETTQTRPKSIACLANNKWNHDFGW